MTTAGKTYTVYANDPRRILAAGLNANEAAALVLEGVSWEVRPYWYQGPNAQQWALWVRSEDAGDIRFAFKAGDGPQLQRYAEHDGWTRTVHSSLSNRIETATTEIFEKVCAFHGRVFETMAAD